MAATLRDIGFKLGYELDKQSEKKVEDSVTKLKSTATKLLGAIGITFSLRNINAVIEEFRKVNRAISSAATGLGDVAKAEKDILDAANNSRVSYEAMATAVTGLVKANSSLFPEEDAVQFSQTVTQLMKAAGKSDSDISQVMQTMTKSFQSGKVEAGTLNSLLEKCPETAQLLCDNLGVSAEELQKMAATGQLTAQQLKDAFLASSGKISNSFGKMDMSISEAIQTVRNRWGFMLADFDQTFGFTNAIAQTINKVGQKLFDVMGKAKEKLLVISDKLGGTDNLLKLIAMSIGAVIAATQGGKIMGVLQKVGGMLNKHNLKIMLIVAAILLVILVVQDLFAFMEGKDSFIGTMMTNAGADTDGLRDSIQSVMDFFSELLPVILDVGGQLAGTLGAAITSILPLLARVIVRITPIVAKLLKLGMEILTPIIGMIGNLIDTLLPPITDLITSLMEALQPIIDAFFSLVDTLMPVIQVFIESVTGLLEPIASVLGLVSGALAPIIEAIAKVVGWVASGLSWVVNLVFGGNNTAPDTSGATAVAASGHAKGTDYTEDTFIAGEEGPELITGAPGKKVFTALETGNILSAMALLGKAATVSPTSLPGASSSRTINQYNEFVNTFNGDRAGQQKTSKAMNAASDDVISMMARALAVSR